MREDEMVIDFGFRRREGACSRCGFKMGLCFCRELLSVTIPLQVVFVCHRNEQGRQSNSARVFAGCVPGAEIHWWGRQERPLPQDWLGELQDRRLGVLFPDEHAMPIHQLSRLERPETLVVLDGSWRQCKSMVRRIPGIDGLPKLRLSRDYLTSESLRRSPGRGLLSTFEATCYALEELLETQFPELHRVWGRFVGRSREQRLGRVQGA